MQTQQIGFAWDRDCNLHVQGNTPSARHSGATGAHVAAKRRGLVALQYRQLLIDAGPQSDYEAASAMGRFVSSINSTRGGWRGHVIASGEFDRTPFGTLRTRWSWVEFPGCGCDLRVEGKVCDEHAESDGR